MTYIEKNKLDGMFQYNGREFGYTFNYRDDEYSVYFLAGSIHGTWWEWVKIDDNGKFNRYIHYFALNNVEYGYYNFKGRR